MTFSIVFKKEDVSLGDTFNGPNGASLNASKWNQISGNEVTIQNNTAYQTATTATESESVVLRTLDILGDFEATIEWNIVSPGPSEKWFHYFLINWGDGNRAGHGRFRSGGTEYFRKMIRWTSSGGPYNLDNAAETATTGQSRVRRVGSTVTFDYNTGGSWKGVSVVPGSIEGTTAINLSLSTVTTNPDIACYWDNLVIQYT